MIRPWVRTAGAGGAFLVAAGIAYLYWYDAPKRAVERDRMRQVEANAALDREIRGRVQVDDALKAFGATTLGATPGEVSARFRGALNDIAQQCGLANPQVDSREPKVETNPGGTSRLSSPAGLKSDLRKQRDFSVIAGSLEGRGTLPQVLRALATLEAQPWIHRVDGFSIKPEGKERDVFTLRVGVSTLFAPDLAPKGLAAPEIRLVDPSAQLASIIEKNVFREPTAVVQAPAPQPAPTGPALPPYADWRLTGVVESRLGVEAFLVNVRSGERLTLASGSAVAEARFVSGRGETAVFDIGGQQFEVNNGQTLEQRRPAKQ